VRAAQTEVLIDRLLNAGLGPSVPGGDDVRNIMVSPTLGIDRQTLWDVEPLAEQLSTLLQTRFHALSPKFALLLDGGERIARLEHPHDIWLAAMPAAEDGEQRLVFGLAGCPPLRNAAGITPALAAVPARHVLELVEAALQLFVELATAKQTRMRQLLAELGAPIFLQRLQQRLSFPLITDATVSDWRRAPAPQYEHIGSHAQRQHSMQYIGAAPVLGRIDAAQLRGLAKLITENSGNEISLRFTPWQSVLLANIVDVNVAQVSRQLQSLGFSCDPAAALTRTIACAGATGCAKGLGDTKTDAQLLAAYLEDKLPREITRPTVHLSGCLRSCAAAHIAPFTLLAVARGQYDLFQRAENYSSFGKLLARQCSIEEAGDLLVKLSIAECNT
jgi:precorrin-3B synthase